MKLKKSRATFIAAVSLATLAALSNIAAEDKNAYRLFDRIGDLLLISKENDIFMQMVDGTKKGRVTESIDVQEKDAFFSKDGRYILFMIDDSKYFAGVKDVRIYCYLRPIDGDKASIIEITEELYKDFKKERLSDKYKRTVYLSPGRGTENTEESVKSFRSGAETGEEESGKAE
ncbi:MAG: hypothetical protein ABID09_08345 [Candidatus Omnitrophota bacterium]